MSGTGAGRIPKYRHYRPKNLAVVRLNGRDFYLGKYATPESYEAYDRHVTEWLAAGRQLPGGPPAAGAGTTTPPFTINRLLVLFLRHARNRYARDGKPTDEFWALKSALRPVRRLYGTSLVSDFGPKALKLVQQSMIQLGWCRGTINDQIHRVRRMFRWGVAEELVPAEMFHALQAVDSLRKGATEAREKEPVKPVPDDVVDATLPGLPATVANMVRLQRLTGCRPEEVCLIRPGDLDRQGDVWAYSPGHHKTEHRGRQRVIFLGPRAQAILGAYLSRPEDSYCFSPRENEQRRNAQRKRDRRSPMTPSQAARQKKRKPCRTAGERYTTDSYRRAVQRAVAKINKGRREQGTADLLPEWSPNRLRHTAATEIRKQFGLEAAQVTLGHAMADVTQIYAEKDMDLARRVMRQVG